MIHVASLIHDDVIDESDTRQGRPSANARWQSHKAVILGDFILARNMNIGLSSGQFDLVTHVCGSMAALCEGEVLQSECAEKHTMTRQAYLDIIYKKDRMPDRGQRIGRGDGRGCPAREGGADAPFRRGDRHGVPDTGRHPRLHAYGAYGQTRQQRPARGKITLPLLAVLDKATPERRAEAARAAGRLPRGGGIGGVFAEYGRERGRAGFLPLK